MPELFSLAFMQRALIGGAIVALLLGWLGVFVVSRKMSFIGAGIAHASLGSIAIALLIGWSPLPVALVLSVVLALILYWLQEKTNISQDTAIGIIFATGMALGIFLLQFYQGYVPELMTFLFGNILAIRTLDLLLVVLVGILILIALGLFRRELTFVSIDAEGAQLANINRAFIDIMMYIFVAVSVVLSIKIVGIVLVSALLVLPAAISKIIARSFLQFQIISIISSLVMVFAGILISYQWDLPTGATIVLFGTATFIITKLLQVLKIISPH